MAKMPADPEATPSPESSPSPGVSAAPSRSRDPASGPANPAAAASTRAGGYDSAKLRFVGACGAIAVGLGVAGSIDRATGGVLVLIGWIAGVATLHRLGRAGSSS